MIITSYLKTHSLYELHEEHCIKHRFSKDGWRVSLNYEIFAKKGDKLVEECRGLVLGLRSSLLTQDDIVGETVVLARPMDRFYNEGELDVEIDWSSITVQEKLDGTMCILYDDCGTWRVATRNVPDADVELDNVTHVTFNDLFMQYVPIDIISKLDRELTYVFELVTAKNKVVVDYDETRHGAYLLAIRHRSTGAEIEPSSHLPCIELRRPKTYDLKSLADIVSFVSKHDAREFEGCVVIDDKFRRLKVKNPAWCVASHLTDTVKSHVGLLRLVVLDDPLLQTLDGDMSSRVNEIRRKTLEFCEHVDSLRARATVTDRKSFALSIRHERSIVQSGAFQAFYDVHKNALEWLRANVVSDAFCKKFCKEVMCETTTTDDG